MPHCHVALPTACPNALHALLLLGKALGDSPYPSTPASAPTLAEPFKARAATNTSRTSRALAQNRHTHKTQLNERLKDEAFSFSKSLSSTILHLADFHSRHWEHCKNTHRGTDSKSFSTYHSIYCHVEKPSWSDNTEESVNVLKDRNHHFILVFWCWSTMTSK